ncbi:MAG: hypothetical protein AAF943_12150 [Pseudomonadota bacterium]
MQMMRQTYHGLGLIVRLNFDRVIYIATIGIALAAGAFVGSM